MSNKIEEKRLKEMIGWTKKRQNLRRYKGEKLRMHKANKMENLRIHKGNEMENLRR